MFIRKIVFLSFLWGIFGGFWGYAQEEGDKTIFPSHPYNYKRASTAPNDRYDKRKRKSYLESKEKGDLDQAEQALKSLLKNKHLLPTYDEMASNPSKGISLEDWEAFLFTKATFYALNTDNEVSGAKPYISRKELEAHKLLGETKEHIQDFGSVKKHCKSIPELNEKLKRLKKRGHSFNGKEVKYYVDKDYETPESVGTQTHVDIGYGGKVTIKKVTLGEKAHLLIDEMEKEESVTPYLLLLLLFVLLFSGTFLISKLAR